MVVDKIKMRLHKKNNNTYLLVSEICLCTFFLHKLPSLRNFNTSKVIIVVYERKQMRFCLYPAVMQLFKKEIFS